MAAAADNPRQRERQALALGTGAHFVQLDAEALAHVLGVAQVRLAGTLPRLVPPARNAPEFGCLSCTLHAASQRYGSLVP